MEAAEARALKKGQWVCVSPSLAHTTLTWQVKGRVDTGETDWQLVQQVCHGGLVIYCVDPLAHFTGDGLQMIYSPDHVLTAGPMMNKPEYACNCDACVGG